MRIYVTHCSSAKNESLKGTSAKVSPQQLYTSARIQSFMRTCTLRKASWAIVSDLYGIWFPNETHEYYEKSPDDVDEREYQTLLANFNERLAPFEEVVFYRNRARFHSVYRRLVSESVLFSRITFISHYWDIR